MAAAARTTTAARRRRGLMAGYPNLRAEQIAVPPARVGHAHPEPVAAGGDVPVQPGAVADADDQQVRPAVVVEVPQGQPAGHVRPPAEGRLGRRDVLELPLTRV